MTLTVYFARRLERIVIYYHDSKEANHSKQNNNHHNQSPSKNANLKEM